MSDLHREHNESYRLHRPKPDGLVAVFNQDGYFMAEYNPITGATAWHRVVAASKREAIERRLSEQFPTHFSDTAAPRAKTRSRTKKR